MQETLEMVRQKIKYHRSLGFKAKADNLHVGVLVPIMNRIQKQKDKQNEDKNSSRNNITVS